MVCYMSCNTEISFFFSFRNAVVIKAETYNVLILKFPGLSGSTYLMLTALWSTWFLYWFLYETLYIKHVNAFDKSMNEKNLSNFFIGTKIKKVG